MKLGRAPRSARTRRPAWERDALTGRAGSSGLTVGVLVYRGVATADVEVPLGRLVELVDPTVVLVGPEPGTVHGVEPSRPVVVDATPADAPTVDVLVVPGGLGWKRIADDPAIRAWLVEALEEARAVLAVSTGSLLLAAVGRLEGLAATGHWLARDELAGMGAEVRHDRVTTDETGRLVTAAGSVAAGQAVDALDDAALWSR